MVTNRKKDSDKIPGKQGSEDAAPEPNKINASTPYGFSGKNLTPYGGLLPAITMLEKLGFQSLVAQTVTSKRIPRAMDLYRFVLGIVLGLYIGLPRLNQLRFIARDPILTGILKVTKLPVQSTFWRFVNALHRNVARQILTIMRTMRERVWEAANVRLAVVTIDTDTTVHTLYGQQMGGRKSYNPKNKGKNNIVETEPKRTGRRALLTAEWVLAGLWVLLEVLFLQTALASAGESEYRAAAISWIAVALLAAAGVMVWFLQGGRARGPGDPATPHPATVIALELLFSSEISSGIRHRVAAGR